jgi:hypothetical protein
VLALVPLELADFQFFLEHHLVSGDILVPDLHFQNILIAVLQLEPSLEGDFVLVSRFGPVACPADSHDHVGFRLADDVSPFGKLCTDVIDGNDLGWHLLHS